MPRLHARSRLLELGVLLTDILQALKTKKPMGPDWAA